MILSVIIPARNEEGCIARVVGDLSKALAQAAVHFEIIVVNDNSSDATAQILTRLAAADTQVRLISSQTPHGFGMALRAGIDEARGEAVVFFMGDGSDDPQDVLRYYRVLQDGYDCVFGSRFMRGSRVSGYPPVKLFLNRIGNLFIQFLFWIPYNDTSNAFKAYRIEVLRAIQPLVSTYFNISVEIPLKAIVRKFSYAVIPVHWNGRGSGVSKYSVRQLTKKYFFSILFVWFEKILLKEELTRVSV